MQAVSLVVPTYNEAENIVTLLERVGAAMWDRPLDILVVDDDSPDETWRLVEEYGRHHPKVRVIRRVGQRGLSAAVIEGFRHAHGDLLAVMDADLSHDPVLLPELVEAVAGGADLAVGSRRVPGGGADVWPWYRRLASSAATALARRALGVEVADAMSGYFVMRRWVYESVADRLHPRGYKILLEIIARAQPLKLVELPYVFRDRRQGVSKVNARVAAEYLTSLWMLRRGVKDRRKGHGRHPRP